LHPTVKQVVDKAEVQFFQDKHQAALAIEFMKSEEYKKWVMARAEQYRREDEMKW